MHHYRKLQELLNTHPVGAPFSEEYLEILRILFRPGEVELALKLSFKLKRVTEIAQETGIAREELVQKMEDMANRGVILAKKTAGEPAYALLPNYPGLFEYPVMKGVDPATERRLAELWHAYYMKEMAAELAAAVPPWNRVLPAEEAIPTEIEILPYEAATEMMSKSEAISLGNCPCRTLGQKCSRPKDVCLAFDGAARFLAERGMARFIDLEEARQVLKKAEEAALVHTASNNAERLLFICNCCPCCCHFLRLVTEHNYRHALAHSSYEARIDTGECTGCAICVEERCPAGALSMEEDVARLDPEKCLGCGLCVSACPTSAITLVKRKEYTSPPANVNELMSLIASSKQQKR
ncbi:MAG: 4Fe-4S binding protein [Clostridia bacterium]|nr:4Fe-4S binding protein [Clostridia bacterium]